ncbi:hypothetical protein [Bacillus wiedmannii]|uniref:hypothetical protein n=1 Tax=Bacillus wiedmannii TaxID=1890302 RepID=UPI000BFE4ED8|nr:hypothetical protein [Bacillus wiedmannii]PHE70488.1 hypothetical protein COF77_25055 [Bacillus wiedmannii]
MTTKVKTKIMPGEVFIVEYVDGAFVNRWAINASKDYIEIGEGRKAAKGFTDLLVEPAEGKKIIDARFHVTKNAEAIKFLNEVSFGEQEFAHVKLQILKVAKQTDVFDRTGAKLGTIPAGSLIGTDTATAGNSFRHLMVANAFNDGSGWKFINQTSYSYGFVNVQLGHGLQQFDPTRTMITAKSETVKQVDWKAIETAIATDAPEKTLRGDLAPLTKEKIVETVSDHFASEDLVKAQLMDPIEFFKNAKNRAFVERQLNKVDPKKAADFVAQANAFNA